VDFANFTYVDWMLLKGAVLFVGACIYGGIQGWYDD